MTKITPVLLAGGYGTRLWPLSRKSYPKQFSKIIGKKTLFQQTVLRLSSSAHISFERHIVVTNSDFRFIVGEQLQGLGIEPGSILIEPEPKNTAPAILAASLYSVNQDSNAILLVAPSDHAIPNTEAFHTALKSGLNYVNEGNIVTFGVTPNYPATGYGYLEIGNNVVSDMVKVEKFIEKPVLSEAEKMVNKGGYFWNTGIFMFRAKDMISAFKTHAANYLDPISNALNSGTVDLDFFRLDKESWSNLEAISLDYAIMEKINNLVAIPFFESWSDLGSWDAVWDEMEKNSKGVALSENAYQIDCQNTMLRSESNDLKIVGLGLENVFAIAMRDAVLVAHRDNVQDVKNIVAKLKTKKISQAEVFPKDHRPWGWFESLVLAKGFQVKRIQVNPGAALSLQRHDYRSEHWVVVKGVATVTIDSEVTSLNESESIYIPLGSLHRLENSGKEPLIIIEVQTGSYLGEDDIVRIEDAYNR